ncbi:MAG: undecaprenyl-diphosphate phosphatase [Chitinophagales bacterium]|nr:undecaprenyl-diphosphate phosphatase [Chitinophagales bacterium]MDW8392670.1 undecaprenyl-diphosphate phosphatase [Chitinophagales bacterium]
MTFWDAIILAIVEGITEYLPISSTGHMVITNALLGIQRDPFAKAYIIIIQFGAILSVVVLYWKRFFHFSHLNAALDFYGKLVLAFLPAAVVGVLLNDYIDRLLGSPKMVAYALVAGGIFFLFTDKIFPNQNHPDRPLTVRMALGIGIFQILALFPGVSRAASVIIGGLAHGLNRKQAAEFSFFLAVPTLMGASVFDLRDNMHLFSAQHFWLLLAGTVVSFVVAMLAIKAFISYLARHGLMIFGWYRILVGGSILVLKKMGISLTIV